MSSDPDEVYYVGEWVKEKLSPKLRLRKICSEATAPDNAGPYWDGHEGKDVTDRCACISRRQLLASGLACAGLYFLPGSSRFARGHRSRIDVLNLEQLEWAEPGGRNRRKVLSVDPDSGALTFYLELPPHWRG